MHPLKLNDVPLRSVLSLVSRWRFQCCDFAVVKLFGEIGKGHHLVHTRAKEVDADNYLWTTYLAEVTGR